MLFRLLRAPHVWTGGGQGDFSYWSMIARDLTRLTRGWETWPRRGSKHDSRLSADFLGMWVADYFSTSLCSGSIESVCFHQGRAACHEVASFFYPSYLKQVLTGWRNLFAIKAFRANMCSPARQMEHFLNDFDSHRKRSERGDKTWKVIGWTVRLSHSRVGYAVLAMRCSV